MKKMIRRRLKLAVKITLYALITVMFAVVVYVMVCNFRGKVASIGGYSVMKVVTGSMEPSIHVDDYILIKKTDISELKVGDVITFLSDDPEILNMPNSHRITSINEDGTFTVKGDANPSEDVYKVRPDRIIGRYVRKMRLFRFIGSFASSRKLLMILFVLPTVAICIYESRTLIKIIRGTDEEQDESDDTKQENLTAEKKKEKLIREAIEKEKERLRQLDKDKQVESEVMESEPREDNEA